MLEKYNDYYYLFIIPIIEGEPCNFFIQEVCIKQVSLRITQ